MEQGIRLTVIGMGTAFVLLLLLTFMILIFGWLFGLDGRFRIGSRETDFQDTDQESYDKALAAVVAVSTVANRSD